MTIVRIFATYIHIMTKVQGTHIVEEAAAAYQANRSSVDLQVIISGSDTSSEIDKIRLSRAGVSRERLDLVARYLGISLEQLSHLLHISYRTILRKKKGDQMGVHVSEQVIAIAEVIRRGIEVMETEAALKVWLHTELPGLDDQMPITYLDTSFGATMLLKMLGRIEHGVY